MWFEGLILLVMAASRGKRQIERDAPSSKLRTGRLIDDFERKAQERAMGTVTNLTEMGTSVHGIEQSTKLSVLVFEEGIWITPENDE